MKAQSDAPRQMRKLMNLLILLSFLRRKPLSHRERHLPPDRIPEDSLESSARMSLLHPLWCMHACDVAEAVHPLAAAGSADGAQPLVEVALKG